MSDIIVLDEFQQAVKSAVADSIEPDLPIAFDVPFEGNKEEKYIEIVFIPNNYTPYWEAKTVYRGSFRLVLHWPINTGGPYPAMELIKSVCDYFTTDLWLERVQLQNEPILQASLANGAEILYPATVRYQYFPT
jgi:hypothetical protein